MTLQELKVRKRKTDQGLIFLIKFAGNQRDSADFIQTDISGNEPENWKQLLQFRGTQAGYRRKGSIVDACTKQKNIRKLKRAMILSYHQEDGIYMSTFLT